jgi:ankyrin repeat protein
MCLNLKALPLTSIGRYLEAKDSDDSTPLLYTLTIARLSFTENIVKILVEAGANVEAVDRGGRTPLLNIVNAQGWFITDNIVKILLEAGANIEAVDRYGARALAYATGMASWNSYRPSTTKILLEAGAQIHNNVWEVLPQELKDKHGAQRNWKDGPPRRQFGGVWHK